MVTVKKKVGDREALRYRRWDRGRNRNAEGPARVQWKELLAWATIGEDDQLEDDRAVELYFYFLRDKEIFDGRGNVESHHPGGGLLEERAGAADLADVWDQARHATSGSTRLTQARVIMWSGYLVLSGALS